jgi:hypothetical protein
MNKHVVILLLLMILVPFQAVSRNYQEYYEAAESINPNDYKTIFSDNTIWRSDYELLRIYFAPDGESKIQLFTDFGKFKVGDIVTGTWFINEQKHLCINAKNLPPFSHCYRIEYKTHTGFSNGYSNEINFINVNNDKIHISFDRRSGGNFLIKSKHIDDIKNDFSEIYEHRRVYNFKEIPIPQKPHEDVKKYPETTQKFILMSENRVFKAPINYQYHDASGYRALLTRRVYEQHKNDIEKLKESVVCGRWWIHDKKSYCYSSPAKNSLGEISEFSSCASVHSIDIMENPTGAIVTNSTHHATMMHDAENFVPLSQFPHPSIFAVCEEDK